jgi:OOP family OmpA-OmpF porin
MAEGYSWSATRSSRSNRLPGPDRMGWWATLAMAVSLVLHGIVFFALDQMKIAFKFQPREELTTRPIEVRRVQVEPAEEPQRSLPPEEVVIPPNDSASLLEEIDLLEKLPENAEIEIKPAIVDPQYALQVQNPAAAGEPEATAPEISMGFEIDTDLPELGREPESIKPAAVGQLTVDPGAVSTDDSDIGKFAEDLIKQGANGKAERGTLDGMTSLEDMLDLPPNILIDKKTMLPSDLLFEFNSAVLRESAKLGLMKLVLLMDKNPGLYCWIEGHTDLLGGDEFNLNLSLQRAQAVKSYIVKSAMMDESRIITRGFGRYHPIVASGTAEEQAANRRVEIKMRKNPPSEEQLKVTPEKGKTAAEGPAPKAILVKPQRAPGMEEVAPPKAAAIPEMKPTPPAPKAAPVEEAPRPPAPPKAAPVQEMPARVPLKAEPVEMEPEIPKATPVEPAAPPRAEPILDNDD